MNRFGGNFKFNFLIFSKLDIFSTFRLIFYIFCLVKITTDFTVSNTGVVYLPPVY